MPYSLSSLQSLFLCNAWKYIWSFTPFFIIITTAYHDSTLRNILFLAAAHDDDGQIDP